MFVLSGLAEGSRSRAGQLVEFSVGHGSAAQAEALVVLEMPLPP